ncbi:hypothetical protein GE061_010747 [Apolygus lucorum]|uniref:B box-type domain-containing protein n=1 Tax=Apolygus lucorum TaxID=248454 RepID=A0A8S9XVT6_APOLU|nr:hypothetical protein GE061_010747 [Apolygus lucorum]
MIQLKRFMGRGYNDSRRERVPLVLQCNHSSCENCILTCIKMSKPITCSVCQEVSSLPSSFKEGDIRSLFPVNMHLLGLWSKRTKDYFEGGDSQVAFPKKVKKEMMIPKKNFQSCHECTGPADCFCETCITPYCHLCFKKVHSAARILKDHKSIALIQEPGVATIRTNNYMCSVHHDKKLELFCNQCYVSICSSCLVSEHNGHNLKSIADKNKEFHDEIIASFARVTDVMNNMVSSRKAQYYFENTATKKNLLDL